MAASRRVKIKGRFYLFAALFAVLVIWGIASLVRLFNPPVIEWGRLETDQGTQALVVRNEEVLSYREYIRLDPIAAEGSFVDINQPVATLYTLGYSPKDVSNLMTLQQTIKDYQTNNILKSVVDKDLDAIEEEISKLLEEISRAMDRGDKDALLGLEQQLSGTMERRRVYMNTTIQADSHLQNLYQQEKSLQERIDANKATVLSPIQGTLSYLIDGYEKVLRPDMMMECGVSDVRNVLKELDTRGVQTEAVKDDQGNAPVFRVVQNSPWYLMMILPKANITLSAGSECEVTIDGYPYVVNAYVVDVRSEKGQALVILEIKDPVSAVLSLRRVSVHIGRSVEGFRVARDLIGVDEKGAYILVRAANGEKRRVDVVAMGEDVSCAIVAAKEDGAGLTVGMRLFAP